MLKSVFTLVSVASVAFLANLPATAEAASSPDQVSVRISYADLNLSSEAGAREMLGRIERAAKSICGDSSSNADLDAWVQQRACVAATVNDSVRKLDAPTVTALNGSDTYVASR